MKRKELGGEKGKGKKEAQFTRLDGRAVVDSRGIILGGARGGGRFDWEGGVVKGGVSIGYRVTAAAAN